MLSQIRDTIDTICYGSTNLPPLMSPSNPSRPNRRSMWLQGYDYTQPGAYFVTLLTYQRLPLFGEIRDGSMYLSKIGRAALSQWMRLPRRFPSLSLGVFTFMPNHLHRILIFQETRDHPQHQENQPEQFGKPVAGSLPTIIRSYKASVTLALQCQNQAPRHPVWQRNYYEHVVRSEVELKRIEAYILNNPHLKGM